MMKLALFPDCHRKGVSSAAEYKFIRASEIAAQINASQSSSNRHISKSTVQMRLHESGLHGRITTTKGHQQEEESCLGQETH